MSDSVNRMMDAEARPDDRLDNTLRPNRLAEIIGQDQVRSPLLENVKSRWIMSFFMVRRG